MGNLMKFSIDAIPFDEKRCEEYSKKINRELQLIDDAAKFSKLARVSIDDALKIVSFRQEFWQAVSDKITVQNLKFTIVAQVVNRLASTDLNYKTIRQVLRYRVSSYREWESAVTAPKREEREREIEQKGIEKHFGMALEAETNPDILQI